MDFLFYTDHKCLFVSFPPKFLMEHGSFWVDLAQIVTVGAVAASVRSRLPYAAN